MLKIKDGVDFKILEKFGFKCYDEGLNEPYYIYKKYLKPYISINIDEYNGIIAKDIDDENAIVLEEDIKDLIKADLVEKVSD